MNIGYVFLIIIASAAYFVSSVPTPEQMTADFSEAQGYYASGAYDQAIEKYAEVGSIESRFVDEDQVIVTIGSDEYQIKDATTQQTANSYRQMAATELASASNATDAEEKAEHHELAMEYIEQATEYFYRVQEESANDQLKVLAQKLVIDTWYLVDDYDRVIQEGQRLIDIYPASIYVQDALYNIGWAHYDAGRYDEAIDSFEQLVNRFPTGSKADQALFQIGESYFAKEEYDEAVPYYQRLVDKMRINEMTELEILKIQREKNAGLVDDTALDRAARAALRIGACYGSAGRYAEAEASYKRMAQIFTYDNNLIYAAYSSLADMYYDKGQFEQSIEAYRDAIDEVPDRIIAAKMQNLMAQRYAGGYTDSLGVKHEYYDEAITAYRNYIANYSDVAYRAGFDLDRAYFELGRAYYENGSSLMRMDQPEVGRENIQYAINTYQSIFEDFPATQITEQVEFYLAMAYQETDTDDNIRTSLEWYTRLLEEYPESNYKEYVYVKMGRAYQSLGDHDTAEGYFTRLINEFPESQQIDSVWFELALNEQAKDENDDDLGSIEYFLNVSRDNAQLFTTARLLAGQVLIASAQYQRGIDVITYAVEDLSAISTERRLSQLYLMRGNAYKSLGNNEAALADYTAAYDINDPATQQQASVYRASVYIDMQQYARAEADLQELMGSDDENIQRQSQIRLAYILVQQGKSDQAIQTYYDLYNDTEDKTDKLNYLRSLIQLSATSKNWARLDEFTSEMIGSDLAEGEKPEGQNFFYKEEAFFMLGDAAESRASDFEAAGDTQQAQNMYIEAINHYIDGFDRFPDSFYSSDMLLKVGLIYLKKLQALPDAIDQAAASFAQYVDHFPDSPNAELAQYYLGYCYYSGRRFTDANNAYREFVSKFPNSEFTPEAVFYYSDCEYNLGNLDAAIAGFDRLLAQYPNSDRAAEGLYTKAWCYLDLDQSENAIATFQQLVERYPGSQFAPTSLFSVADYYYNQQQFQDAIATYERVLELYPDSDVAQKVPQTVSDLREAVAYIEYDRAVTVFTEATATGDLNLYQQAVEIFQTIITEYPGTESEIGALSNMGLSYEALGMWQEAVEAYDKVIDKFEAGEDVSTDAFDFATVHKNYIVSERL